MGGHAQPSVESVEAPAPLKSNRTRKVERGVYWGDGTGVEMGHLKQRKRNFGRAKCCYNVCA